MSPAFLITLREGLEISLVLAILLGYLVKTERRDRTSSVWLGAGIAAIACLVAGVVVHAITDGLEGKAEQAVEGTLALGATVVLTWMILWMRKNARTMGGHLRTKVDSAASPGALAVISFVAVAREGFETVLFLLGAETESASASQVVLGGLLGLVVAAVVGVLVYRFGTKIDLGSFFRITGVLLILFAAGLAGKAVHEFRELVEIESGWLIGPMWNISDGILAKGTTYDFLRGLFGWSRNPERIRVFTYFTYLLPVLWSFLRPEPTPQSPSRIRQALPMK